MGIRFRRSVRIAKGVKLNLSKSGVGISGGVKGARVGIGPWRLSVALAQEKKLEEAIAVLQG